MSDEPEDSQALVVSDNGSDKQKRARRTYTEEEKIIALLDLDANSGNVHRTALALDIPYATLAGWDADRRSGKLQNALIVDRREKRGDLTAKMESVLHSLVESMAGKIAKATLSQTAVATGILVDKVRILRGQGLDPDPAAELCRLLNLNRAQLPPALQLEPGEEIPEGFGRILETKPDRNGAYTVENPSASGDAPATEDDKKLLSALDDGDESAN
jgi:hypothetical protein